MNELLSLSLDLGEKFGNNFDDRHLRLQEEGEGVSSRRGHRVGVSPDSSGEAAAGEDYVHAAEADGGRQVEEGDGQRTDAATRTL